MIKRIEVSEITPNINVADLIKLQKKYPGLPMAFGVELYGTKEHGNVQEIDDGPTIRILRELNAAKASAPHQTSVHLNYGYADMFNRKVKFETYILWNIISKKTDRVVYNINTLSDGQKQNFCMDNLFRLLDTKANLKSKHFTNSEYFIVVNAEASMDFIAEKILDYNGRYAQWRARLSQNLLSLMFENNFDDWAAHPEDTDNDTLGLVASRFWPRSWCGGIGPDNVKSAMDTLRRKFYGRIDKIDISARGGVMTDGKADMDKIEALMKNANEWLTAAAKQR